MMLYERLIETQAATLDDRIRGCRVALTGGNAELGRKLLDELRRNETVRQQPEVLALEAHSLALDGSWDAALAMARKAADQKADRTAEDFLVASLLVRAAEHAPETQRTRMRSEAIDILGNLVSCPEQPGIEAIAALATLARQPAAAPLLAGREVGAWVDAAARHPKSKPRLRIAAWDLRLAATRSDAENIYREFLSTWRDANTVPIAAAMYDSRDFAAAPILADALEDAGCTEAAILDHLRDPAAVHVRGCWAVDLVLGKS